MDLQTGLVHNYQTLSSGSILRYKKLGSEELRRNWNANRNVFVCGQIALTSPPPLRPTCDLGDGDLAAAPALPSLAEGLDLDDVVLVDRQRQLQGGAVGLHHAGPTVFVLAVHHLWWWRGGEGRSELR